ncbi:MAG: PSD1 and planctomycete cytochrome C domain-containing protein [Planctomycetota bacterium]|nr:PSD1 and planctomycete cytochrome C domain-containing protein [Planctomycetota bacterium]
MKSNLVCATFLLAWGGSCWLAGELAGEEKINFSQKVLPILSNKCFVCHGPDSDEAVDLKLDTAEAAYADLGGYQAINRKDPAKSELLKRIHSRNEPMPPEDALKQLTDQEKAILDQWVLEGGEYSTHWAYLVPGKSQPVSDPAARGSKVIDGFVQDQLTIKNFEFAAPAPKSVLARRTALVLTGLPPEPKQLAAFMKDQGPAAFVDYVDSLLADEKYGEHQARYWLDAVRYGDTHGLHLDNKRGIYPYRDWVIRALNKNMAFDQFITWQLAGDLMPNPTLEQKVATGFIRMNPSTAEGGAIPAEFQAKNSFDRTENLGTVFLGMSLVCARCHTHKYDPIPQEEYYRLMAFFNNTAEASMDGNSYTYGPILKAPKDQQQWMQWESLQQKAQLIDQQVQVFLANSDLDPKAVLEFSQKSVQDRIQLVAKPHPMVKGEPFVMNAQEWVRKLQVLEKGFTTTLVAQELAKPRVTRVLHRGEYNQPVGGPLSPGIISVSSPFPKGSPNNRLGLAHWITSRKNPLTSRVLVNRVWQRVFGYGLVRTPEDFGLQGQQPTHPELLDWLAVEFQESGWDLKSLLKLMVLSRTFQQSSAWREEIDDPENRYFARGPSYRLDAEVIRDIALWGSGLLANEKGGEGIKPYQPPGMWKALAHPGSNTKNYVRDQGEKLYRRSLYVYWKRTSPHPMMTLFDAPSRESSCVQRSRTNTSLQSLGLLNETQRIELARKFAERLLREKKSDPNRLDYLYELLVCRKPSDFEKNICNQLLQQMKARYQGSKENALELLSTGEAKRDESLSVVDLAAWTQVLVTVLASDASLLLY